MTTPTTDRAGIQQAIRALRAADWDLDYVHDGEEDITVKTEPAAVAAITAVDQAWLHVRRDGQTAYVFFVLGNDPDEVVCDYTTNLESVIGTLTTSWFE